VWSSVFSHEAWYRAVSRSVDVAGASSLCCDKTTDYTKDETPLGQTRMGWEAVMA
jgi:hypothetical protein